MWPFTKRKQDPRSGRLVFVIECLLNQNARDSGAANSPAVAREMLDLLANADVGMAQITCPEMACLGFERQRPPGSSIRQALESPESASCCKRLAEATADRMQGYLDQGFEVLAVLGGNEQSPGCAVHTVAPGETQMTNRSGVFMQALATALSNRRLRIPFRGVRDADPVLLHADLAWLRERVSDAEQKGRKR